MIQRLVAIRRPSLLEFCRQWVQEGRGSSRVTIQGMATLTWLLRQQIMVGTESRSQFRPDLQARQLLRLAQIRTSTLETDEEHTITRPQSKSTDIRSTAMSHSVASYGSTLHHYMTLLQKSRSAENAFPVPAFVIDRVPMAVTGQAGTAVDNEGIKPNRTQTDQVRGRRILRHRHNLARVGLRPFEICGVKDVPVRP